MEEDDSREDITCRTDIAVNRRRMSGTAKSVKLKRSRWSSSPACPRSTQNAEKAKRASPGKLGNCVFKNVDNGVLSEALSYLDVVSIDEKNIVCKQWNDSCTKAIQCKGRSAKKSLQNNEELRKRVKQYVEGSREEAEELAGEYGYPIRKWDVSKIKDFSYVFARLWSFNEDIGSWNVANATNMEGMFYNSKSFCQNLSRWKNQLSNVTNMSCMFWGAQTFDGNGISDWDVSSVTTMRSMFHAAKSFNGDLSNWNVSQVTNMRSMFEYATAFDGRDICKWDVSNVRNVTSMFENAKEFDGEKVADWDTSNVVNRACMLKDCKTSMCWTNPIGSLICEEDDGQTC